MLPTIHMKQRKAQVTLFVIIAVVAVAVISLFTMFQAGIIKAPMGTEAAKKLIASQTEPLRDYTSGCVEAISMNYFQEAMLHGGYYYYDNFGKIYYAGGEKVIIAYKNFEGQFNNVLPSLERICGNEFNSYMEREGYALLDDCVRDFSTFKKYMDIDAPKEKRKITAECRDEDIIVKAEWPIVISRADVSSEIEQKSTKLLIPLKRMWQFSNDIVNEEVGHKNFIYTEIEGYMWSHKYGLKHLLLESRAYPTHEQTMFFVISKPYRTGEEENRFYFAVDRIAREEE